MTGDRDGAHEVHLRDVEDGDLDVFFEHQADPKAIEMAAFAARDKDQFAAHWAKVRADDTLVVRTIVADGMVAGNIGSETAPPTRANAPGRRSRRGLLQLQRCSDSGV